MERRRKLASPDEIPGLLRRWLPPGGSVCLGGGLHTNRPVALARELIRCGVSDLHLFSSPPTGYDVDLLIGAGVIKETFIATVTLEPGIAPNFRAAVESGRIKAHAVDAVTLIGAYTAAAQGLPFYPVPALRASDTIRYNPLVKPFMPPFGDEEIYAVRAVAPDVALIHAQEADPYGNVRHLGHLKWMDDMMAKAARHVIVSVDRVVSPELVMSRPQETSIPCIHVDAVVHIPYGAHPTASAPLYAADMPHIHRYAELAEASRKSGDPQHFQSYLQQYIYGPASQTEYLERVGGVATITRLAQEATVV